MYRENRIGQIGEKGVVIFNWRRQWKKEEEDLQCVFSMRDDVMTKMVFEREKQRREVVFIWTEEKRRFEWGRQPKKTQILI